MLKTLGQCILNAFVTFAFEEDDELVLRIVDETIDVCEDLTLPEGSVKV